MTDDEVLARWLKLDLARAAQAAIAVNYGGPRALDWAALRSSFIQAK